MFINYFVTSFYFLTGQILVVYHLKKKQKKPQKTKLCHYTGEDGSVSLCELRVHSTFSMLAYQMNLLFYFYLR